MFALHICFLGSAGRPVLRTSLAEIERWGVSFHSELLQTCDFYIKTGTNCAGGNDGAHSLLMPTIESGNVHYKQYGKLCCRL